MKTSKSEQNKTSGYAYNILRIFTVIHPGEAITAFLYITRKFIILKKFRSI